MRESDSNWLRQKFRFIVKMLRSFVKPKNYNMAELEELLKQ